MKTIFIIRQINLQQRLQNEGTTVSFTYPDSDCYKTGSGKLIVETTTGNETRIFDELLNLMTVTSHCGDLSKRICQYFARYDEMRDLINHQLQELNIDVGIAYIDQSISVVAINSEDHDKVIAILQEAFDSNSIELTTIDSYISEYIDEFLSTIKESIPQSNNIWIEAELDSGSSNYILTITGPRNLICNTIKIIKDKEQDYKKINTCIKDISILKTEYLKIHRQNNVSALEKKFSCRILIGKIKSNVKFNSQLVNTITITCHKFNEKKIKDEIHEIIGDIIVEKDDSISLYSRFGRLHRCKKSKNKLDGWQKVHQCLLFLTDHHGYRYVEKFWYAMNIILIYLVNI